MNANTENSFDNLWVKVSEEQAEKLVGGNFGSGYENPGGKQFKERPGKGHTKNDKAKSNWEFFC